MVPDEAHAAFGMEVFAIKADNAGRFLAAVLKRMETERRQRGGVGMIKDAENPTFLVEPVLFEPAELPGLIVSVCHAHWPFPINK